jgi:hypothetical protein
VAQAWDRWLKGSESLLTLTFDPSTAAERREIVFITPTHPIARQAAQSIEPSVPLVCSLLAKTNVVPPGRYPYAIYRWRKIGIKEDFLLQPVCCSPELTSHMLQLLETAHNDDSASPITFDEEQEIEKVHYHQWISARSEHIEEVIEITRARTSSLSTSHAARMAILEEQRDLAVDTRIRRMRESQIETAKQDYERRSGKLRKAAEQGDIVAEAVVFGTLKLEGKENGYS